MNSLESSAINDIVFNGWVDRKAKKIGKGLVFGRLRDINGDTIQLVDSNEPSLIRSLKQESAITVKGDIQEQVKLDGTKSLDLQVKEIQVLNESSVVGSQLTTGDTKEWPPQYRYLQLRQTEFQQRLQRRAKVMSVCRSTLDSLNFTEVETPLLFKSTPEGAREFLVPTRKKNLMYALPQSPQQYKQLLMASGVHRYYQIARCFRDEDLRADRQPEFTQLDLEMSFANKEDVQKVVQKVVQTVWKETLGQSFYILKKNGKLRQITEDESFTELSYDDAISRFGIDKPDLRSSLEIFNASAYATSVENTDFPIFELLVLRDGLNKEDLLKAVSTSNEYGSRIPTAISIESEADLSLWHEKFKSRVQFFDLAGLNQALDLKVGDIVLASDRRQKNYENPTPLGKARQIAISQTLSKGIYTRDVTEGSDPITSQDFVGTWVTDFPLFNPVELESTDNCKYPVYLDGKFVSTHHPFTMAKLEDYEYLKEDPLQVRGQHYDLVVNGVELGGGSTRVHDVELQRYIFEKILQIPNPDVLFGHLLTAFSTGCPPHAGLAIGFDRMTAMLSRTDSIRDVIAFPKTITGADPMIGSPSKSTANQLKDYHIRVI